MEFGIQRRGYAAALVDPEVLAAIRDGGSRGRIALAYVEWAGARRQVVVLDWMVIDGLAPIVVAVRAVNAIGAALVRGVGLIEANGFAGDRRAAISPATATGTRAARL